MLSPCSRGSHAQKQLAVRKSPTTTSPEREAQSLQQNLGQGAYSCSQPRCGDKIESLSKSKSLLFKKV